MEGNLSTKSSGEKSKRKADGDGDGDGPPASKKANLGRGPDDWIYAPPMGKVVFNKFLPMKTPLDETYDREINAEYRFHPADVFEFHQGKVRIWFDLTMSDRYYKSKEVGQQGCRYVKLKMDGRTGPPSRGQICEFIGLVKKHYDVGLIAVHCTHGFNRTGFAIVSYLVEVEKMKVTEAIQLFREARPDGIYKQDYLQELIHRYGAGEVVEAPRSPSWRKGPIADDDYYLCYPKFVHMHRVSQAYRPRVNYTALEHLGGSRPPPARQDGSSQGLNRAMSNDRSRYSRDSGRQFMADLPLQYLDGAEGDRVRKMVAEWLDVKRADLFAGSQPVSMEGPLGNKNYTQLLRNQYLVSWKADGTRCLLVIEGPGEVYALNRNNDVFLVTRLTFPKPGGPGHLKATLLDVEAVVDEVGGQRIPRFLIYDMMRYEGEDVTQKPFVERYALVKQKVVGPRNLAIQRGEVIREQECAGVRIKDFYTLEHARNLVSPKFIQQLTHHADGLIFQPANEPYKPGAFKLLMKWKSLEESTVDFKLQIEKFTPIGQMPRLVAALYVLNFDKPFSTIEPVTEELRSYHNKIVECSQPPQGRQWKVERVRDDKTEPNAHSTADSVATTIRHQFTRRDLLRCIDSIIKNQGHRGS